MTQVVTLVNGVPTAVTPNNTSAGAGDAGKTVQLNAAGHIDDTMLSSTALAGADIFNIIAFEALSANDLINLFSNAGVVNMRKADATDATKPPMGFVTAAVAATVSGVATLGNGVLSGLTGLTVGSKYYLSTTPGAITLTAPSVTGNVIYAVGYAKSTTELDYVDDTTGITLA